MLVSMFEESENVRIAREKREEAKRKEEEEKRQRELKRDHYNQEVEKIQALENEANDYDMACKIRAYISAVEDKESLDESTLKWIEWAKAKADWYDPTVAAFDPDFGIRKHSQSKDSKNPKRAGSDAYISIQSFFNMGPVLAILALAINHKNITQETDHPSIKKGMKMHYLHYS